MSKGKWGTLAADNAEMLGELAGMINAWAEAHKTDLDVQSVQLRLGGEPWDDVRLEFDDDHEGVVIKVGPNA